MSSVKALIFTFLLFICQKPLEGLSDKRLCVDSQCSEPISLAKTLLRYEASEAGVLSFQPNADVVILSKDAGSDTSYWGAEIKGKRGYIPKSMVKETKLLKKPSILVDTNVNLEVKQAVKVTPETAQLEPNSVKIEPEPVKKIVVDGTTIEVGAILPEDEEDDEEDDEEEVSEEDEEKEETAFREEETKQPVHKLMRGLFSFGTKVQEILSGDEVYNEDSLIENETTQEPKESSEKLKEESTINVVENIQKDPEVIVEISQEPKESSEKLKEESTINVVENVQKDPEVIVESSENVTENLVQNNTLENLPKASESSEQVLKSQIIQELSLNNVEKVEENFVQNYTFEELQKVPENSNEIPQANGFQEKLLKKVVEQNILIKTTPETAEKLEEPIKEETTSSKIPEVLQPNILLEPIQEAPKILEETPKLDVSNTEPISLESNVQETLEKPTENEESSKEPQEVLQNSSELFESTESPETVSNNEGLLPDQPQGILGGIVSPFHGILHESSTEKNLLSDVISGFAEKEVPSVTQRSLLESSEEEVLTSESPLEEVFSTQTPEEISITTEQPEQISDNVQDFFEETPPVAKEEIPSESNEDSPGLFDSITSFLSFSSSVPEISPKIPEEVLQETHLSELLLFDFTSNIVLYLATTALAVIIFLFGHMFLDKSRQEAPLIAHINKLEQQLLVQQKENQILQEQNPQSSNSEAIQQLTQQLAELQISKSALEEQVVNLEKELDVSTDVGMELNRVLTEMIQSSSSSETIKQTVDQLHRQLNDQKVTIETINHELGLKELENQELHLEMDISGKKVLDLQAELDKMVEKILKIEEERDQQQSKLEIELTQLKEKVEKSLQEESTLRQEIQKLMKMLSESERSLEVKSKEYELLKQTLKGPGHEVSELLNQNSLKAELQQLQNDCSKYVEKLEQEQRAKELFQSNVLAAMEEAKLCKKKFETCESSRVEIETKLNVLNNYFKEREEHLQKELAKYETMWVAKEGEASSTTERIKYIQEELQNYKSQNESLKQEIVNQEVDLKSQIATLENKIQENWVSTRQMERKLQEAQQESAQLRHRLTLRERGLDNGDLTTPSSPPLLFPGPGGRELMTKSPPLAALPPFLPPLPLGMWRPPPPPGVFPGDHRPPPLGRMSSPPPPLSPPRYSPDSSAFSPYDRHSPIEYDSEYDLSPPKRGYNPFERGNYLPKPRTIRNGRGKDSGTDNSNDDSHGGGRSKKPHPKV